MNEQEMKKQREEKLLEAVYHNIGSLYIEEKRRKKEREEENEKTLFQASVTKSGGSICSFDDRIYFADGRCRSFSSRGHENGF